MPDHTVGPAVTAQLGPPHIPWTTIDIDDVFLAFDFTSAHFHWDTLATAKARILTHCPIGADFFVRCHSLGVRVYPYVTPYVGANQVNFGGQSYTKYQGITFGSHHYWEIDDQGQPAGSEFGPSTLDGAGVTLLQCKRTCPNVQGYQNAIVAYVDRVMALGADGMFVDNLLSRQPCWGAQLGVHSHIVDHPTASVAAQTQAFGQLIQRIRDTIKKHRADGKLLGNSGTPLAWAFPQYLDSDSLEGFGAGTPNPYGLNLPSGFTWDDVSVALQPYLDHGKKLLAFSPCMASRAEAFLAYARARIAGFTWWGSDSWCLSGGATPSGPWSDLYRIHLGGFVTPRLVHSSGIRYRRFANGIVAVNDGSSAHSLILAPQPPLFDVYASDWKADTSGAPQIPPGAGRVYLYASAVEQGSLG